MNPTDSKKFSYIQNNQPFQQATGQNMNTFEVLQMKINWATQELASANSMTNIKYSIELCEMIKMASEAIFALKRLDQ